MGKNGEEETEVPRERQFSCRETLTKGKRLVLVKHSRGQLLQI
jgi:hypothetical protein